MRKRKIAALFMAAALMAGTVVVPMELVPMELIPMELVPMEPGMVRAAGTAEYKKDENIYGILNEDGSMKEMYIVNQFDVTKKGSITDKGIYDKVTNLTNTEEISSGAEGNSFEAEEGYFYYQGTQKNGMLPWEFSVKYYLNGVEIPPKSLAGANGDLRIHLTSKKTEGVDPVFYDNFMLQVSLTLDNDKVKNIKAKDATIADAGTSRQVNFTVMPGKDADINLKAQVSKFEMSGISIAAIPFSMSVELPDTESMTEDMSELTDGISELNDGVSELKDGADQLKDGAGELADGADDLSDGVKKYVGGIEEFNNGLQKVNKNYSSLASGGTELKSGSSKFDSGLKKIKKGGRGITSGSGEMESALKGLSKKVASMDLSGLSPQDAGYLKQVTQALAENYGKFDAGLDSYVSGVNQLAGSYGKFHEGLTQYTDGVSKMSGGISSLAGGSKKIAKGGSDLYDGTKKYADGVDKFADGVGELADGISELKDGTQEMADGTADMPDQMNEKVDEMMSDYVKDFTLVSFTDKDNTEINAVQFTITTPEIKRNIREKEVKEEKKLGFLERLVALFQ